MAAKGPSCSSAHGCFLKMRVNVPVAAACGQAMVQALHAFGAESDALLMARPVWFRAGVWLEIFVQLPFYVSAIYAVLNKREWIRPYCLVYSVNLLTIMVSTGNRSFGSKTFSTRTHHRLQVMILAEELLGELRSPNVPMMLAAYSPWAVSSALSSSSRAATPPASPIYHAAVVGADRTDAHPRPRVHARAPLP